MMTPQQEEILKNIASLQQKHDMRMRRIENVLVGDREMKIRGLVDKVEYHGKQIEQYKNDRIKITSVGITLSSVFGFLSGFFKDYLFKH